MISICYIFNSFLFSNQSDILVCCGNWRIDSETATTAPLSAFCVVDCVRHCSTKSWYKFIAKICYYYEITAEFIREKYHKILYYTPTHWEKIEEALTKIKCILKFRGATFSKVTESRDPRSSPFPVYKQRPGQLVSVV